MVQRCSNGAPFTILAPIPSVRTGIRVQIYDRDDPATLIDVLPDTRGRQWVDPLNDVGAGEFEIHENDPKLAANPDILRPGNFVRFYLDNIPRFTMRIEKRKYRPVNPDEDSGRWIHVSGRGALAQLEDGAVYPAGGITGDPERDVTGLTVGAAFIDFKDEADARGAITTALTVDFTDALDTNNQPYNFTLAESVRAGRDDLLALLRRWSELGVDHHLTQDLTLGLYANGYGVDKTVQSPDTAPVIFRRAHNLTDLEIDEDLVIKNTFLVETGGGFFERSNPASHTEHGRREAYLSLGNTTSGDYVDRATDAAFARLADIRSAITAEVLDIDDHRPYVDGGKGDWVYITNKDGDLERVRIIGMTVSEDDAGNPIFIPTLNEESAELEARLQKWLRTMDPGTAGGTVTETTAPTAVPAEVTTVVDGAVDDHVTLFPHPDELGDLTDVDLTGLTVGDLIQFDGNDWTPVGGTEEGDMLYRGASGLWIPVGGTKGDGKAPMIQADDSVQWETPAGGGGGGASGATLVDAVSDTGASPHSLDASNVAELDVVIAAMTTRNSNPGTPTGGAAWNELWSQDLSSNEEVRLFWKVAGASEPAAYGWTHDAGADVISNMVVYRGLAGTLIHYGRLNGRTAPVVLGSANGLVIYVFQCCFAVASLAVTDPTSVLDIDLNFDNNDQGIIFASRDAQIAAAQPQFSFTGGDTAYTSAGAIVIE